MSTSTTANYIYKKERMSSNDFPTVLNIYWYISEKKYTVEDIKYDSSPSGVTRALIGGVYIHIFVFCPTDFF